MVDNASRRGAADLAMPLMVMAFLVIGGFMYWLMGQASEYRELQVLTEDSIASAEEAVTATTVAVVDLQTDPTPFEEQTIRVAGLAIVSSFGEQGFWLELPNRNPFLVSMSEEVLAEGLVLSQGLGATPTGVLHAMNDSARAAWAAAGTISEGDQLAAEFVTHFLEATQVVVASGDGGGNAPGAGN